MLSKVIQSGRYNQFVKQDQIIDTFMCKICHGVNCSPLYKTKCCNDVLCKSCIDRLHTKWKKRCPMCHKLLEIVEATQNHHRIKHLDVCCKHEKEGCKWIGQVKAIKKHLKECTYKPTPCEYHIVGCKVKVAHSCQTEHNQKYMKKHFNMVSDCIKELKDTKRQLSDAENKLDDCNNQLIYYKKKNHDAQLHAYVVGRQLRDTNIEQAHSQQKLATTLTNNNKMKNWLILLLVASWCIFVAAVPFIHPICKECSQ